MKDRIYDALVIGSGAAGSFAARELCAQGLDVLMLEAGRQLDASDFDPALKATPRRPVNILERTKATAAGQGVQARAVFFRKHTQHLFINDRMNPYTTPPDAPYLWIRGRQVGGRMHSFGRVLMRWSDDDFLMHARRGLGVDWPFAYSDIAPFYEEVETELGLHGTNEGVPTTPDGIYAKPSRLTPAEAHFRRRVETCWPERRAIPWRFMLPDPARVLAPLRHALDSGRLTLRHDCVVARITTDATGRRATGVEVIDARTRERADCRARSVVLCASPVESARLMLHSASPAHPGGLANGSGTLGRYFMDQLPLVAEGTLPPVRGWAGTHEGPEDPFYAPSGGVFVTRPSDPAGQHAVGDFAFQGVMGRARVAEDAASRWAFFGYGQMLPYADNRITLDPRRRDAWGIPAPHIRCALHSRERAVLERQSAALVAMIREAGGEPEYVGTPLGLVEMGAGAYPHADAISRFVFRRMFRRTMVMGAAIHESGGVRMGTTPETSVLNPFNQAWEIPNLAVVDASCFPGSGVSGTTLTVMAVALRACRNLAQVLARGAIA